MPESVTDRCTKSHEYIFLLSKSQKYYYDYEAILEEATGYDGRKDTMFKGGVKYDGFNQQTMLSRGHERWRYKNLKNKGQQNHSMHEKRANGESDENYPVRNKRSVWTVNPQPFKESHFAVFPEALIEPMILAGSPENGVILDPFMGAGTTGLVARKLNRNYIGFELNPEYIKIAENRILPIEEIKEIGYAKTKISKDHPTLF
jgi:DNA modification methylase